MVKQKSYTSASNHNGHIISESILIILSLSYDFGEFIHNWLITNDVKTFPVIAIAIDINKQPLCFYTSRPIGGYREMNFN